MALFPRGLPPPGARRPPRLPGFLAAALVIALTGCHGQTGSIGVDEDGNWRPQRDVTMIVPFAPGGGSDVFARTIEESIEEVRPDINIVVENRPGGSGAEGYGHLAAQAGDPHYLLAVEPARNLLPEQMDVPFAWDDWTNIGQVVEDVGVLAVSSDSAWPDFDAFIEAAEKADDDGEPLRVALPAAGGVDEVLLYLLQEETGIEFEPVVYDGTGETNPAVMSGDVDATILNPSDGRSELQGGVFVPLLGFSPEQLRADWLSDTLVTDDLGWDITTTKFRGVIAPQDIPEAGNEYWQSALKEAVETDSFQDYVEESGLLPSEQWGDDWNAYLREWNAEVFPVLERTADQ